MARKKDVFDTMWDNPDLSLGQAHALMNRTKRIIIAVIVLILIVGAAILYFS